MKPLCLGLRQDDESSTSAVWTNWLAPWITRWSNLVTPFRVPQSAQIPALLAGIVDGRWFYIPGDFGITVFIGLSPTMSLRIPIAAKLAQRVSSLADRHGDQ